MGGRLVEGTWKSGGWEPDEEGRFRREATRFRGRLSNDGSTEFPAEAGRYHLYVSYACPWAHRTLLVRKLRGLESAISVSVVHPHMGDDGWAFDEDPELRDALFGSRYLRDVYLRADPRFTGRVTVPVLWDKERNTIVCNESRLIIRGFDTALLELGNPEITFCPPGQAEAIDRVLDDIYEPINNGVYRAGFAGSQQAYDEAVAELFDALDRYDRLLGERRYLLGEQITEADWCLFTTLLRFDVVYHYHFKCNLRRIADYPHLSGYLRDLYQVPGVAETCRFDHIKSHYFWSHPQVNPTRIVPRGPLIDLSAPSGRG
jgi:putative glutathione S-transferase